MSIVQQDQMSPTTTTGAIRILRSAPREAKLRLDHAWNTAICAGVAPALFGIVISVRTFGDRDADHAYLAGLTCILGAVIIWIGGATINAVRAATRPAEAATDLLRRIATGVADLRDEVCDLDGRMESIGNKEDEVLNGVNGIATTMEDQLAPRRAGRATDPR